MLQYHGGGHYVGILGDFLARARARTPLQVPVADGMSSETQAQTHRKPTQSPAHQDPFGGLDSADIQYLTQKSAFSLPSKAHWFGSLSIIARHLRDIG